MKVIIAGSRSFDDYNLLKLECDKILSIERDYEIVSGTARGADQMGEKYAIEKRYKISRFPADWDQYGLAAGYRRNEKMAMYAHALIAFWDYKSKGTKHMIDLANKHGLKVRIVKV